MLDLNHPGARYVLEAARVEDVIRELILSMRHENSLTQEKIALEIAELYLPELRRLNEAHFGANPGIARTLSRLEVALAAPVEVDALWRAFMALAESPGDNFGTWTI